MATAKNKPAAKGRTPAASKKQVEPQQPQLDQWEARMYKARVWGHTLDVKGGSDPASVKQLVSTLKDGRALSEAALRRTALEALVPAACVGHRGALSMQAAALIDRNKAIRDLALNNLWEAAGCKRPEKGGAVHAILSEALPPKDANYNVESRRAAAAALTRLAPKGDNKFLATAKTWLEDEDAEVRRSAAKAMGFIGSGKDSVSVISQRLTDGNWLVARSAIEALEELAGGPDAIRTRAKEMVKRSERSGTTEVTSDEDSPPVDAEQSEMSSTLRSTGTFSEVGMQRLYSSPEDLLALPRRNSNGSQLASDTSQPVTLINKRQAEAMPDPLADLPYASPSKMAITNALAARCSASYAGLDEGLMRGLPRADAVAVLGRVAPWGHSSALQAAALRLADVDAEVRREAVLAVSKLAPGDSERALQESAARLREGDWRARAAASEALAACQELEGGDSNAVEWAAVSLEGRSWSERRGAVAALRLLVETGDGNAVSRALAAVAPRLNHADWSIRRKSIDAIANIAEVTGGEVEALRMLKESVKDQDEEVRLALAELLPRIAPLKSKEGVGMAIQMAAEDTETEVRLAALAALAALCAVERSRTREAVRETVKLFADPSPEVRLACQRVLRTIARGRRTAIDCLSEMLKHPSEETRLIVADTFRGLAEPRAERAIARTHRLLRHGDAGVRSAATRAVAAFSAQSEQDFSHSVTVAASEITARFRRARFQAPAGNQLSQQEWMDLHPDEPLEKYFEICPPSAKSRLVVSRKSLNPLKVKKRRPSVSSGVSGCSDIGSEMSLLETISETSEVVDDADARHFFQTIKGLATLAEANVEDDGQSSSTSSRISSKAGSKTSKNSSLRSSIKGSGEPSLKGRAAKDAAREQAKRMKEEQQRREQQEQQERAERERRQKEYDEAMASSEEEDFSESDTEVEDEIQPLSGQIA